MAEQDCSALSTSDPPPARSAALSALSRVSELLDEHARLAEKKLGRLWAASDPRVGQALAAVEAALSRTGESPAHPLRVISELRSIVDRLHALPFEQLLEEPTRSLASLARELGKSDPELEVQANGLWLAGDWADELKNALVHLFRNSLDHGIEPAPERLAAGKPARGKIRVVVQRDELGVQLRISDDGRGLALERLRASAVLPALSEEELAETIFAFGVSTAREISNVSGRGIGMNAVRSELRRRGGDAFAELTGEARQGYRPFTLVLRLPISAVAAPEHTNGSAGYASGNSKPSPAGQRSCGS